MRPPARVKLRVSDKLLVTMDLRVLGKWTRRGKRWLDKGYLTDVTAIPDPASAIETFDMGVTPRGRRLTDRVLLALSHPKATGEPE